MANGNHITAERASEIADESRRKALEQACPKVLDNIMTKITEVAERGFKAITFDLNDVHFTNEAPAGLSEGELMDCIYDSLTTEYGYIVAIDRGSRSITIRWDDMKS